MLTVSLATVEVKEGNKEETAWPRVSSAAFSVEHMMAQEAVDPALKKALFKVSDAVERELASAEHVHCFLPARTVHPV